eukprot:scaffold78833_cov16-Tisochrysis_lutea.AAC.1
MSAATPHYAPSVPLYQNQTVSFQSGSMLPFCSTQQQGQLPAPQKQARRALIPQEAATHHDFPNGSSIVTS